MTLIERIIKSTEYMDITRSGGIIGAIFGFFSYKLLGSLGTYLILTIIILLSIYLMLKPNMDQIIMAFEDLGERIEDKKKKLEEKKAQKKLKNEEKEKKKALKEIEKKEKSKNNEAIDREDDSSELSESLVIKDYSDEIEANDEDFVELNNFDDDLEDSSIEENNEEEEIVDTIKDDIEHKKR